MKIRWPFVRRSTHEAALAETISAKLSRDAAKARADEFARLACHGDTTWRQLAEMRLERLQHMAEILSDYMKRPE